MNPPVYRHADGSKAHIRMRPLLQGLAKCPRILQAHEEPTFERLKVSGKVSFPFMHARVR